MTVRADALVELLPALYKARDRDGALEALLRVLAGEARVVAEDVDRLYDNWFIETCDPWVVPYIGDLLGVRPLAAMDGPPDETAPVAARALGSRSYVANTMAYRRRKGTLAVLEQLALDVTGWRAHAVEGFSLLAVTQYLNHVRPEARILDVRRAGIATTTGGPFDRTPRTADVRAITPARASARPGVPNIPNVALFLWRLQAYRVRGATPRAAAPAGSGRYTFDPLGRDLPLFNAPRTEREIAHLSTERDVPAPLRRLAVADELESRRQDAVDGRPHVPRWFDDDPPVRVAVRTTSDPAAFEPVPPERVAICDLSTWQRPAATRSYTPSSGGAPVDMSIDVAIDPLLGRLTFPSGAEPLAVRVDYAYGACGDIGGGPYDRRAALHRWLGPTVGVGFHVGVTNRADILAKASDPAQLVTTLAEAIQRWMAHAATTPGALGLITILDSGSYDEDLIGGATVVVPEGARLAIVAADWPDLLPLGATAGDERRIPGLIAADAPLRPHLRGSLSARGTAPAASRSPGQLLISGLMIEDGITVLGGSLGELTLLDSTLPPASAGVTVNTAAAAGKRNRMLLITVARSVTGPITLPASVGSLTLRDSIVDGAPAGGMAIDAPGAHLSLTRCSVLGETRARTVEISNGIHTSGVRATVLQEGCVRYSVLPEHPGSLVPRRYRCQPDLTLAGTDDPALAQRRRAELQPAFTSVRHGDPSYAQLSRTCAPEILAGAEDGSAMGAFSALREPQRLANLRTCVDEYLPTGLDAGIFFVT